jgi:hypothetical protein
LYKGYKKRFKIEFNELHFYINKINL